VTLKASGPRSARSLGMSAVIFGYGVVVFSLCAAFGLASPAPFWLVGALFAAAGCSRLALGWSS